MKISTPHRTESQVWMQQFNKHLMTWLQGERADHGALRQGMDALRHTLEREPACAGYVANLVSTLLRQHADLLPAEAIEEFAGRGLDAIGLVREESTLRMRTATDLRIRLAQSRLDQSRPADAIEQLEATIATLEEPAQEGMSINRLLEGQARLVRARAFEALVEYRPALADYERAAGIATALQARDAMAHVLRDLTDLDFPGAQLAEHIVKAEIQMLWRALTQLAIASTIGAGRCAVYARPGTVNKWLEAIARVAETNGLLGIQPVELMPIVLSAKSADADTIVERITAAARKLKLDGDAFEAALGVALVPGLATKKERNARAAGARKAAERSGDTLVFAAVAGILLVHEVDESRRAGYAMTFAERIAELSGKRDPRLAEPGARSVFERPMTAALVEIVPADGGEIPWDEASRSLMARLIDYDVSGLSPLDSWLGPSMADSEGLAYAAELAVDHLARIRSSIRDWPDTLTLIVRSTGRRTMFMAFRADQPAVSWVTDGDYDEKARALAKKVRDDTTALIEFGSLPNVSGLRKLSCAAYDAMPDGLRKLIAASEKLLVMPDPDQREGEMPFEVLHDAHSWLAASKVIGRFPTLRSLVRCLERTSSRDERRHFLGMAFPEVPGYAPLEFARQEVESVRTRLAALGWDAPAVNKEELSPAYILSLLPLTQHLHIASHGARDDTTDEEENAAASSQESIVLPSGFLPSHALISRYFPRMPTAFINACELGFARWTGAGRAQSMAYAFLSAGAPAVIANLLPVEDRAASRLAELFYSNLEGHDFGSSLRIARNTVADESAHPLLWATTVLAGDPARTLGNAAIEAGPCAAYLDALIHDAPEETRRAAVLNAQLRLASDEDDMRLRAAIELVQEMGREEWRSGPDADRHLAEMCKVAWEIGHLPLLGYLVEVGRSLVGDKSREFRLRYLDNAIHILESLEHDHPSWGLRLGAARAEWFKLERGERAPRLRHLGMKDRDPDDPPEDIPPEIQAIADIQLALQARQTRAGRGPIPRRVESSADDVLWNAVIAGYRFHLEDAREKTDLVRDIVARLVAYGAVPAECAPEATFAFAGLLQWLWDSQNRLLLDHQFIEGQCGVMKELASTLDRRWIGQAWFKDLGNFEEFLLDALHRIDDAPYDDHLYPLIDKTFAQIKTRAAAAIEKGQSGGRGCEALATILGMLIVHDTYSFTQGSVPETISERLVRTRQELASDAEARFMPWLDRGFASVREWVPDLRWKWENEAPPTSKAGAPPPASAKKKRRR